MTCITFVEKQEHLMRIEPITGHSVEGIVAGLNSGTLEIRDDNEAWLTRWVLSFGGEAVVVAPESARAAIAKAAGAAIGLES